MEIKYNKQILSDRNKNRRANMEIDKQRRNGNYYGKYMPEPLCKGDEVYTSYEELITPHYNVWGFNGNEVTIGVFNTEDEAYRCLSQKATDFIQAGIDKLVGVTRETIYMF